MCIRDRSKAVLPRGPRGFAPGLFWGFLPVALAAAVAVSAVLFLAVERPFSLDGHGMTRLGLGRACLLYTSRCV